MVGCFGDIHNGAILPENIDFDAICRIRAIFNFIVKSAAKGKLATPQDVLNTKITSRSSTYRHLSELTELEMIYQRWDQGVCSYSPTLKLENFVKEIQAL